MCGELVDGGETQCLAPKTIQARTNNIVVLVSGARAKDSHHVRQLEWPNLMAYLDGGRIKKARSMEVRHLITKRRYLLELLPGKVSPAG